MANKDISETRVWRFINQRARAIKYFSSFFLILISFIFSSSAQTQEENKRKYNNAKELLKLGNYALAMEAFLQVAAEKPGNPYFQYASFYYIVAATKANRISEAKLMAQQIENKYPTWPKINEVRYFAADLAFKERNFNEALTTLKKLGKNFDNEQVKAISLNYLNKINSLDSLKKLHKDFPENPYLGEVLANRINLLSTSAQDEALLKNLIKEFKLDTARFATTASAPSRKKATYNVALLFPFLLNELNPDIPSRPNFYAIDMYEGIKLGNEALAKQSIKLNLFTYDTGKDNQKLGSLLEKSDLKNMDLIIGPLSNTPIPAFDNFVINNGIYAVNPVGSSNKLNAGNPFLLLSEPTIEIQAKNTASFILKNFTPKKVAIFYGGTAKDSLLAMNYKLVMQSVKGVKVTAFNKVTKGNVTLMSRVLSDSANRDLGNIFISSGEQTVAANFVSEVEKNGYKIPIVTLPQWLDFPFFNLEQFERLNFHFIYPNYIDYSKPVVEDFRTNYKKTVNIIPSVFSYVGYDLIQYLGTALYKNGTNFQKGMAAAGFAPGIILSGYDFSQGNSNNFVPLVKFEEGQLKIVNAPVK